MSRGCADGDEACLAKWHTWDLSLSQTWGPPYDATSKLWDMTHNWCSGESDAPAVINMKSMTFSDFKTNVRALSTIEDKAAREKKYSDVLTALHDEAIFLPITAKRQTAVTNKRVGGFQFGYMEFDLPLANLYPASTLPTWGIATIIGAVVAAALLGFLVYIIMKEKKGTPVFTSLEGAKATKTQVQNAVA